MKIRIARETKSTRSDLVIALVADGGDFPLPPDLAAAAKAADKTGDLKRGFRDWSQFRPDAAAAERLAFVGLGKAKEVDTERVRRAAAFAQERAEQLGVTEFWLHVGDVDSNVEPDALGRAVAEGLVLGGYRYEAPRKEAPKPRKAQRAAVHYAGGDKKAFAAGFDVGVITAEAANFARDLANRGSNLCRPRDLADAAKKLAGEGVKVKVLEERDMQRLKMGALLGVARGSTEPAKLIVLEYAPAGSKGTVCVVGKGLTFDSGGISIKPSAKMDEMRYDMCGGAAVLGLFHAIRHGALKGVRKKRKVIGLVGATENMPGGNAQKPGDVVTAFDGTTIEVLNTDAEGRLVLADALGYAVKTYRPQQIVDLATLTGAVVVALGHEATGILGNDDALVQAVITAGGRVDERMWQLPLWQEHKDQMKSKYADLQNINPPGQGGGTIAAAAFLSAFVGDTTWAHLDIAATAWGGRSRDYHRTGATGVGVRTLVQWLRHSEG